MVFVGLAYFDVGAEEPFEQQKLFGRVVDADEHKGIFLSLEGQRAASSPTYLPIRARFREAKPGEYRLRTTGEVLVNPRLHGDVLDSQTSEDSARQLNTSTGGRS